MSDNPVFERIQDEVDSSDVVLFMKGSPDAPRCGFSRQIVEILQAEKVAFGHFDILTDEEVRQGLKTFSNWPTYPQLYAEGSLIGGLDIVKALARGAGRVERRAEARHHPLIKLRFGSRLLRRAEAVSYTHLTLPTKA